MFYNVKLQLRHLSVGENRATFSGRQLCDIQRQRCDNIKYCLFLCSGWLSNDIYMMNNHFCSIKLYEFLCNGVWYHILVDYLKYTNNIHAQFFRYLLFYMKPDDISIIISVITDCLIQIYPLLTETFSRKSCAKYDKITHLNY